MANQSIYAAFERLWAHITSALGNKANIEYVQNNYMSMTDPVGVGSLSIGRKADTTVGEDSVATGVNVTASGSSSHAEGYYTTASGSFSSHAEGYYTTASGWYGSHAEGNITTASGSYGSHAEGHYTTASGNYQHVQGKYNISDTTLAHIVGNGYETEEIVTEGNMTTVTKVPHPSNAHTLDFDGNAWFAGDVYVGSTSGTNKDDGSVKLATVAEVSTIEIVRW